MAKSKTQTIIIKTVIWFFVIAVFIASYWINFSAGLAGTLIIYYGRPLIVGLIAGIIFNGLLSRHAVGLFILIFVSCLIIYCGAFYVSELRLEHDVYKFDLNGDKEFSPEEQTPEWQKLDARYIGDGGRKLFAVYLLPLYSAITTFIVGMLYWMFNFLRIKIFKR